MPDRQTPPLPIEPVIPAIRALLCAGTHVVLVAPPGAGKSTRLPLALLEEDWLGGRIIRLVVPRRLAALGAARRMADGLGQPVGQTVGHRVRFDTRVSAATRLEVVTTGVFTAMIADDPELSGIGLVMFDEVHERALEADLGLAFALEAQAALRPDLRLMAMSATVDGARFADLIGRHAPCEQVTSEGMVFPVETHHEPCAVGDPRAVAQAALRALARHEGDALVFLPGQREIETACRVLREALGEKVAVHALYGAVSRAAQDAALAADPQGRRKLVVASAIAETSLTIPGVRFVVDSGLARRPRYDPARGITRLETRPASRAAIDQRRGRAGRTAPGVALRLWRREEEGGRAAQDRPEILDADLADLRLAMALWGALAPDSLPFLDAPPRGAWDEAGRLLQSLGALDIAGAVTPLGTRMARRPTHPRLAAMMERAGPEELSDAAWAAVLVADLADEGALDAHQRLVEALRDPGTRASVTKLQQRLLSGAPAGPSPDSGALARHLVHAFPERIARRQKDDGRLATYKLVQGTQASLEAHHPLSREGFLLVLDLGGSPTQGPARVPQIRLALPLEEAVVREQMRGAITRDELETFDPQTWSLQVRLETRLGALTLAQEPRARRTGQQALAAIKAHLRRAGVQSIALRDRAAEGVLARHQAFHAARGEDDGLVARLDRWLPVLVGEDRAPPFTAGQIGEALLAALDWQERQAFERQWPSVLTLRGQQAAPILYDHPAGPAIAVRPQALYGLDEHPAFGVAGHPILIELLSPARRPIALTADLPAFWRAGWKDVRKDMRARYPRHDWPEEPWAAVPTDRGRKG